MSKPKKTTVDYFPHYVDHGKTLFNLQSIYGNDGYAFWFKTLELLGKTENHYYDCNDKGDWRYLLSYTNFSEEKANEILKLLAELRAIDNELWEMRIIFSEKFIDNLQQLYSRRGQTPYTKTELLSKLHTFNPLTRENDNICLQSKVKESKGKESRVEYNTPSLSVETDLSPILNYWNQHSFLADITAITEKRSKMLKARIKEHSMDAIYKAIDNVGKSSFLRGQNDKGWMASFDWVFLPNNFIKVLEGNYNEVKKSNDKTTEERAEKAMSELQNMLILKSDKVVF
jgi:hypothetical protein